MKNLLIVMLSIFALISLAACAGIDSQELEHPGKKQVEGVTAMMSETNCGDNKFVEKFKEKSGEEYTWILYKIWESNSEE